MPKIMSLKIGSPGVLAVTIPTRLISLLVKWQTGACNVTGGDGETPTIVNLNIETATTENPIVEYSDEAVSACFGVYTQKAEAFLTQ